MSASIPIAIKVQITRNDEVTNYRLRGAFSFDAIRDHISQWWEGNSTRKVTIEYLDDDNDRVRLVDADSWEEAVRGHVEAIERGDKPARAPLLLYVGKPKSKGTERVTTGVDAPAAPQTDQRSTTTDAPAEGTAEADEGSSQQPPWVNFVRAMFNGRGWGQGGRGFCGGRGHGWRHWGEARGGCGGRGWQGAGPAGGWEGFANSFRAANEGPDSAAANRTAPPADGACRGFMHMARSAAISAAVKVMDDGRYDEAEQMLRASLTVFADDKLLEYNLACALARLGKLDDAVAALSAAVRHGYDDVTHMSSDADLEPLRKHPQYLILTSELLNKQAPPEPEKPRAAAKEPEMPSARDQSLATLAAMFPQLSGAEIGAALDSAGGDLRTATERCLKFTFN